ncbi:uncharacterized protein PV09_00417 [Verruconis gallopava]|uniref:Calcineurin-like phosphoesterase domain-containing protein n=1 Tax=Verruconis gallopava TaxID=253628 RepID=A0A0D2BDT0_9PEZI|nr:uncharacterized protein PV09_00417 [Verruconis gallopava]KIW09544.1 hypothetical protein PV09_00417 [Verruconis gallopava]
MPSLHAVTKRLAIVLLPLSIALTAYLYLYPFVHRCAFPAPPAGVQTWLDDCAFDDETLREHYSRREAAPFRLLALGDPQLEGDTSLPAEVVKKFLGFQRLRRDILDNNWEQSLQSLRYLAEDICARSLRIVRSARKHLDLLGNDFYLAHIYRTLHWATQPTHVTVLGDLLGSQWIDDGEFERRAGRFWHRVFRGAEKVPRQTWQDYSKGKEDRAAIQVLGSDVRWRSRIINVAGNHDIGYAGDIGRERIERFERQFGRVNGDIRLKLPAHNCTLDLQHENTPNLRLVVLNSMNLDGPAYDGTLQQETYKFINSVIDHSDPVGTHYTSTILLTHIPLHKESGVCVDEPFFSYFPQEQGGGVQEQNMLSKDSSLGASLQGIFGKHPDVNAPAAGLGRDGIILTGHDHEGCDVYHYVDREQGSWTASRYESEQAVKARSNSSVPGLREVTVRSMMGEFGGNAALVSAWWDQQQGKWQIEVQMCSLGVQHIWWAIHVIDVVSVLVCLLAVVTRASEPAVTSVAPVARTRNVKSAIGVETKKTPLPMKKKSSAFSRRLRQSLEEDGLHGGNLKSKKSPGSKTNKKKP